MKYIGRISFVSFSLLISVIKMIHENSLGTKSIIEPLFNVVVALFAGYLFDRASNYRKKAEMNEKRYRDIIKYLPEPILIYQNEQIVLVNQKLEKLLEMEAEEILGKSIFNFVHPDYHSVIQKRIQQAKSGNQDVNHMEIKIINKQNQILDIEVSSIPVIYDQKPSMEVFLKDITERKKLEEEVRKNEELYRFITENTTDVISYIKPCGEYEYLSPSCLQIMGYSQIELAGKDLFSFLHPDDMEAVTRLVKNANSSINFATFTHRFRKKDGSYTWLETSARTIRNNQKELVAMVAVSRNIDERMIKEQILIEKNEELLYLSKMDSLTDIPNRRTFEETFEKEWHRNMRDSTPLSVLMIDIDYFKNYNDYYGHLAGDLCLKEMAKAIKLSLNRSGDFVGRYGGEEFVVLLPNTNQSGATQVAENILASVRNLHVKTAVSEIADHVTISIGCATVIPNGFQNQVDLIQQADQQLYAAKQAGKNQVM